MVQAVTSSLPFVQSDLTTSSELSKPDSSILTRRNNDSSPLSFQNSVLLAQAFKPVPAVAPLPVVALKNKGRWIGDKKSGKQVLVSNLPDGRVRIEVAKGKAYYEIGTPDWDIQKRLADPTSMFAKRTTYRISAADVGKGVKTSKVAAKTTKQANSGVKPKVTVKNADTYNVDRSYTPPNMLPEDRFLGYAGIDVLDNKKQIITRYQVLVGVKKKGGGFYTVDAKGLKTDLPDVKTDAEAMRVARNNLRYSGTGITPMIGYVNVKKPNAAVAVNKPGRSPFDNLSPDIWLVGASVAPPIPLVKTASLWCQFPFNGAPPIIFGSVNPIVVDPRELIFKEKGLAKLAKGIAYTYNTKNGKWEAGLGGSLKVPLPAGNNAVIWLNARAPSDSPIPKNVYPQIPAKGEYTISVNGGVAIGLLQPLAITGMGVATLAGALGAAAPVTAPVTGPITGGGLAVAKGAEMVSEVIGGDGYLGLGWRLELRYLDGELVGLFKDGHEIQLKDLVDYVQKKIQSVTKNAKK
jgi:hypothetical protein